jgi:hypothetical protein
MAIPGDSFKLDKSFFHSFSKTQTEDTQEVYESEYKAGHTVRLQDTWADDVPYASTISDADSAVSNYSTIVHKYTLQSLTEIPGSNGEAWYINDGGAFIKNWISPIDIQELTTNKPSHGYEAKLYKSDNTFIPPTTGAFVVDYFAGLVIMENGFTPADLGWGTPKITCYNYIGRTGAFIGASTITAHGQLTGIGAYPHSTIDSHINNTNIHFTEGSINHSNIQNIGTYNHSTIDSHIDNNTIHFNEGSINHSNIQNIGIYNHSTIDSHIDNNNIHFTEGSINHSNIQNIGTYNHSSLDLHVDNTIIHFTEANINHSTIKGIGTKTHAVIDSHINNNTIHFTEANINHSTIKGIGINTHSAIDTHIGNNTIHFTEVSINHSNIQNIGTFSHSALDAHLNNLIFHFTENSINHSTIKGIGTNTHSVIDIHIGNNTIHFTEGSINHSNIQNIGTYNHSSLDLHVDNTAIHFTEANINHSTIKGIGVNTHSVIDIHIGNTNIHFTEGSINHSNIQNIGTYNHSTIDSHIDNANIHFTEASINHSNIQNIGTYNHSMIDSHIDNTTFHFAENSINHSNIQNIGTYTHTNIDNHIDDLTIHYTEANINHSTIKGIGLNTHSAIDAHISNLNKHREISNQITATNLWSASTISYNFSNIAGTINHNELSNLLGGTYHLSQAQQSSLTSGGSTLLHHHDSRYYTILETDIKVSSAINALVDGAPALLDTLNELALALGNDENFSATVTSLIATKASIGHTHVGSDITDNFYVPYVNANQNVDLNSNIIFAGGIDLKTGLAEPTYKLGRMFYDETHLTAAVMIGSSVTLQLGQEDIAPPCYNISSSTILNGKAVYEIGVSGENPIIALAMANDTTTARVVGITTENIESSTLGIVTSRGLVHNVDTSAWEVNDPLYLSDTVPGGFVNSPNDLFLSSRTNYIGKVLVKSATAGVILVNIQNESTNLTLTEKETNVIAGINVSTGVYSFSGLTAITGQTVFNVSPVKGWIIKNTGTYATAPEIKHIMYDGASNVSVTNILTPSSTYVLLNDSNILYQQTTYPTPEQRRDNILLGKVAHPNGSTILAVNNTTDYSISPMSAVRDMFSPISLINEGVTASPNGANLTWNLSSGSLYGMGINWAVNSKSPNKVTINAATPKSFFYRTQLGGSTSIVTNIDPNNYDLNGVITALPTGPGTANSTTNQRIYLYPTGIVNIQYGQKIYTSMANAIAGQQTEMFVKAPNSIGSAILIGIIAVRRAVTTLNTTTNATFTPASIFGESIGGVNGISTTTLQQAYDNSTTPEILTDSSKGALTIKRGSDADTDIVLETTNGAGNTKVSITGEGDLTLSTLSGGLNQIIIVDASGKLQLSGSTISDIGGGISVHSSLTGLQGGTTNQYYHLTLSQESKLTSGGIADIYHIHNHSSLNGTGVNTHSTIDVHISNNNIHFTEVSINHSNIQNIGTYSHGVIDNHINDSSLHWQISNGVTATNLWSGSKIAYELSNVSSVSGGVHSNLAGLQGGNGTNEYYHLTLLQESKLTSGGNADSLHNHGAFGSVSHNDLSNIQGGTTNEYYHLTLDEQSKLTSGTIADIYHIHNHSSLNGIGLYSHSQIDSHINNSSLHWQISNGITATNLWSGSKIRYEVDNVTGTTEHNLLSNIQGGTTGNYYHSNQPINTTDHPTFSGLTIGAGTGFLKVDSGSVIIADTNLDIISSDTNFTTGILNINTSATLQRVNTTLSFNDSTHIFSIAPSGGSYTTFDVYLSGVKTTFNSAQTVDLDTTGLVTNTLYFIYFYDNGGICTLTASTTPWEINSETAPIATLFWNGTTGFIGDERHDARRNIVDHKYAHQNIGTKWTVGLEGTFNINGTFSFATGRLADEDIVLAINSPVTSARIWYTTTGPKATVDGNTTVSAVVETGVLKYNETATYTLAAVTSGYFVRNYFYGSNDTGLPIAMVVGQSEYSNINDARSDAFPVAPTYINNEVKLLYTTIWQNIGGTATYIESTDYRATPTQANGNLARGPVYLDQVEDVSAPTPSLGQVLTWNGTSWVNGPPVSASVGAGLSFYDASPTILNTGVQNDNPIRTLSRTPIVTTEQSVSATATTNTVISSAWAYFTALGRLTIDSGTWNFNSYAYVNAVNGGRQTYMQRAVYSVLPQNGAIEIVTITGTGTSRTASVGITGTAFATSKIDASATNTLASYLQTPTGLFQITARANDYTVTITTPTTYVNESNVIFNVWKRLFIASSPIVTATSLATAGTYTWSSAQPSFTITSLHQLGAVTFVTSNNTTTLTTLYDGTTRNTSFTSPLITLHNDLPGLQGGAANDYYHLTSANATKVSNLPTLGGSNQILGVNSGASANENKTLSTGTAGTDFAITHGVGTVTFNLPDANATNRGVVTNGTQSLGGQKTFINSTTFSSNVTINGGLTVNGSVVTVNSETVLVEDNILVINNGEVGTGVTKGYAGIEIDRGVATNYQFIFQENNDTFRVGESGLTQAVATREDAPNASGIAFWNNSNSRFNTDTKLKWNGSSLNVTGSIGVTGTVDGVDIGTDVPLNTAHRTSNGTDHTFINQDVRKGAAVLFDDISASSGTLLLRGEGTAGNIELNSSGNINLDGGISTFRSQDASVKYLTLNTSGATFSSLAGGLNQIITVNAAGLLQKSGNTIASISVHSNLTGLQGGTTNEYYHLTNTQQSKLTSGGSADTLHRHNHSSLTGAGTKTHAQIDSHIALTNIHFTEASIGHNDISNLQGGTTNEYYHLTAANHGYINQDVKTTATPTFKGINGLAGSTLVLTGGSGTGSANIELTNANIMQLDSSTINFRSTSASRTNAIINSNGLTVSTLSGGLNQIITVNAAGLLQKSGNTIASISVHSSLTGLQGGTTNEYYHLTNTQQSKLTAGGTTTLHKHNHNLSSNLQGGTTNEYYHLTSAKNSVITNTSGTNTGNQSLSNSGDTTSHLLSLSASGGSLKFIEGANITLTTGGTSSAGSITIAATGSSGGSILEETITQTAHGFTVPAPASSLTAIYHNGTSWQRAIANTASSLGTHVVTEKLSNDQFKMACAGVKTLTSHGLTVNNYYFVSSTNAGQLTITDPAATPDTTTKYSNPLVYVRDANTIEILTWRPTEVTSYTDFVSNYYMTKKIATLRGY